MVTVSIGFVVVVVVVVVVVGLVVVVVGLVGVVVVVIPLKNCCHFMSNPAMLFMGYSYVSTRPCL
jgi:hypothetical protein